MSNFAKFLEQQNWKDHTKFMPIKGRPPVAPADDAEVPDLCYKEQDANFLCSKRQAPM